MKKIIIIMISVVIIWGVSGCMNQNELKDAIDGLSGYVNKSTNDAAEAVTRELELKYGCQFEIKKTGGRIDSDSVAFYLSPKDDSGVVFKASINTKSGNITDNYIGKNIAAGFVRDFENNLAEYGIRGAVSAAFTHQDDANEDDIQISAEEYFEKYKVSSSLVYLALDNSTVNSDSAENLIKVCRAMGTEYGITIAVNGVVLSDRFSACASDMKSEPDVSATWFDVYSPISSYHFAVANGDSNISKEELKKILAGD